MSPKQKIYQEILRTVLPRLRSLQTQSWWRKIRNKSAYYDSELVHNLYVSLFEEDFTEHDIHFLNVQAKSYFENAKGTENYDYLCKLISELLELVPPHLQQKIRWRMSES